MSSGRYDLESRRSKTFGLLSQTKGTFRKLDDQPIAGIHLHRSLDEGMLDRDVLHRRDATETLTYNECAVDVEFPGRPKDAVDGKKLMLQEATPANATTVKEGSVLKSPSSRQEEPGVTKPPSPPGKTIHKKSKSLDEKTKSDDRDKKHGGFLERLTKSWRRRDGDEALSEGGSKKKRRKDDHHSGSSSSSDSDGKSGKGKNGGRNGEEMFEIKLANSESQASLDAKLHYDLEDGTVVPISEFKVNDEIDQGKTVFPTPEIAPLLKYQDSNGGPLPAVKASPKYTSFAQDSISDEESPGGEREGHERCDTSSEDSDVVVDMTPSSCFYDTLAHEKPTEHVYDKLEYKSQEVSPYEEIVFGNDAVTINIPVISINPDKVIDPFPISDDNGIDACLTSIVYEDFDKDASRHGEQRIDTDSCPLGEDKNHHPPTDVANHVLNIDNIRQSAKKRKTSSSSSSSSASSITHPSKREALCPPDTETPFPPDTEAPLPPDTEVPLSPDTEAPLSPDTEAPLANHQSKSNKFKTFKLEATVVISPDDDLSENTMTYFGPVFLKPQKGNGEEFFKVVVAPNSDQTSKMAIRHEDAVVAGLSGQATRGVAKLSPEKCWPECNGETRRSDVTAPADPTALPTTCSGRDGQIEQLVVNSPRRRGGAGGYGEREDQADASRKPEDQSPEINRQINQSLAKLGPDRGTNGVKVVGESLEDVHGKRGPCVSDTKLVTDENGLDTFGRGETKETKGSPLSCPANQKSRSDSRSSDGSGTDSDSVSKKSQPYQDSEPNVHIRQDGKRVEFLNPRTFLNRIKGSPKNVFGLSRAVKIPVQFGGHLYPETRRYKVLEQTITIEHIREPEPEQKTIEFFTVPKQTDCEQKATFGTQYSPVIDKNESLNTDIELLDNNNFPGTNCAGQDPETKLLHEEMDKLSVDQQKTIVVSDVDLSSKGVEVIGYYSPVSSPKLLFKQMQNMNLTETSVDRNESKDGVKKSCSSSSSGSDSDSGEKSQGKSNKVNTRKQEDSGDTREKSLKECHHDEKLDGNKDAFNEPGLPSSESDAKVTVKDDSHSVLQIKQETISSVTSEDNECNGSYPRAEKKMENKALLDGHKTQKREDPCQSSKEIKTPSNSSPSISSSSSDSDHESDDSGGQCSYDVTGPDPPNEAEIDKVDAGHEGDFSQQKTRPTELEYELENVQPGMNVSVHVDTPDVTRLGESGSRDASTESLTFISNTSSSVLGETIIAEEQTDLTGAPQPVWDESVNKTYSSTSSFSSSDDEAKAKTGSIEASAASKENTEKPEIEDVVTSFPGRQGKEIEVKPKEALNSDNEQVLSSTVTQKVEIVVCGDETKGKASPVDTPLEKLPSHDVTVSSRDASIVAEQSMVVDKIGSRKVSKEKPKKEKKSEKDTKSVSPPADSEQPRRKSKLFSWPFWRNKKKQEDIKQKEESQAIKVEPEIETKDQVEKIPDTQHVKADEVDSASEELTKGFERMTPRTSTPLRREEQTKQDISQTSEASHDLGAISRVDVPSSSPGQIQNGVLETTLSCRSASKRSSSKSRSSTSSENSAPDAGQRGSDSGIPSLSFISQVESVDANVSGPSKLSSRPELCPETTKERSGSELSKSSSSSKECNEDETPSLAERVPSLTKSSISPEATDHNKGLMVDDKFHDDVIHNQEDAGTLRDQPKDQNKLKGETKCKTKETKQDETKEIVPGEENSRGSKKIKTTKPPRQKSKSTKKGSDHGGHTSTSSSSSGDDKRSSTKREPAEESHSHSDNANDKKTLQLTKETPSPKSADKKRSKLFGKKLPDLQIKQEIQLEELAPTKKDEPSTGRSPATPRSKSGKISKFLPALLSPTKKEPDVRLEDSLNADQRFDGQFHREDDITQGVAEDVTAKEMKTPPPTPASENVDFEEGQCDSQNDPVGTSQPRHFVVVAIDFGTTHSGYAFSFVRDPTSVYMMRRWAGEEPGVVNQKTLTSLLLTPEGEFHSFGYSARSSYLNLIPVEAKHWMYFSTFKMELHHNADLNRDTTLVALNGAKFPALKVFAYALDFFKNHALQQLSDQSGTELLNDDIRWVITVPAIWKAPAKQFMRQAAYEAGLASASFPEQLLIALEPEAASIYCRRLRMHQLIPDQPLKRPLQSPSRSSVEVSGELAVTELTVDLNKSSSSSRATLDSLPDEIVDAQIQGSRYLIVDCGGGTVDITVHELDPLGHIVELHRATGGPHGSIGVDAEFERLLCGIFGIEFIEQYKRKYPMGWVHLMTDFESRKRSASPFKSTSLNVSPPFTFINDYKKHKSDPETAVKRYGDPEVEWSPQGMLRLTPVAMRRLFLPTLTHIKQAVGDVLNHPNARELKYMFLVGGFAESPLLQHEMRQEFGTIMKILIPQEVSLAILKGAVLFGIDPSIVNIRRSRLTYGVGILNRFDSNIHPESKRVNRDGVDWCIDVFDKYVETDQPVMLGTSVVRSYTPAKKGQVSIILNIYSSLNPNVRFITDPGVTRCGTLCLSLAALEDNMTEAAAAPGPREIQTRMSFGDTEISVVAVDVATGKLVKASVDFLGR
ncbi:unnamed protein product [Lymnaea stagnalis]|uniref:Uncharacterized protein n=1 Tax=Lymnaea stagnalis TaxID=6523 RepID=A0AAV2GZ45_LYMST